MTDPYYNSLVQFIATGKSHLGIFGSFEPNYWRNGVRNTHYPITSSTVAPLPKPTFTLSRTCNGQPCTSVKPGDTYGANWTTENATKLSYACSTGPATSTNIGKSFEVGNTMSTNFSTHQQLIAGGWTAGNYACNWTITGSGGTITQSDSFTIE